MRWKGENRCHFPGPSTFPAAPSLPSISVPMACPGLRLGGRGGAQGQGCSVESDLPARTPSAREGQELGSHGNLPTWLVPAAVGCLGRLKRDPRVARASPVPTSAPARFRPEAGCSFWAGALPDAVPMGTAVGTRCLWSGPQFQPALQFRQRLWGSEPLEERWNFWCPSPSLLPTPPKR